MDYNNDDQMLEAYGYTKSELLELLHEEGDIGSYFDGDIHDLLS